MSALVAITVPHDDDLAGCCSLYGLTSDEAQVAAQLRAGRRPYQVAHSMRLSILTVELYRARLMRKMSAQNDLHLLHLLSTIDLPEVCDLIDLEEIQSHYAL